MSGYFYPASAKKIAVEAHRGRKSKEATEQARVNEAAKRFAAGLDPANTTQRDVRRILAPVAREIGRKRVEKIEAEVLRLLREEGKAA